MLLDWKESYNTDIPEIDAQHKKLFAIASEVYYIASLKDDYDHYDEIIKILKELADYTMYHFNYEEKLMREYNFEGLEGHLLEHSMFVEKVDKIFEDGVDANQNEAILKIMDFIVHWIADHILQTDMKYKSALKK